MSRPPRLTEEEARARLAALPGWTIEAGKLHRELAFPDFVTAFGFMTQVALVAEKMDHHPEWSNVYGRVTLDLVTHAASGLTEYDFELARRAEALGAGAAG